MYNHQIMSLRRSLTQDDLKHRLQVALHEGSANIAQTLVGLNVRTAYTHAGKVYMGICCEYVYSINMFSCTIFTES